MKLIIIGFDKCGQTALGKHLNCKVDELVYYPDAVERFITHYSDHTPVFILRDKAEKLWSEYHYFGFGRNQIMTWEEFLDHRSPLKDRGYTTPIERTDYWRYITPFKELNPLVVNLEDMKNIMTPANINLKNDRFISEEQIKAVDDKYIQLKLEAFLNEPQEND